jgi:HD-like signal output (HDOD) protein
VDVCKGAAQQFDLASYWRRLVYSAAAARIIAKHTRACDPDDAFVAALLQDVGMLACFAAIGAEYASIVGTASADHDELPKVEMDTLGFDHAMAGAKMAEKWRLPEQICESARLHHRPDAGIGPHAKMIQVVGVSGDAAAALTLETPQPKLVQFRRRMRQFFDIDGHASDELLHQTGAAAKQLSTLLNLDTGAAPDIASILAEASEELAQHQVDMERRQSDLARQTVTDALTGAFNRKHFDAR